MPAYTCDRCGHAIDKAEGYGTYPKDGGAGFVCGLCIRDSVTLGLKPERLSLLRQVWTFLTA